MLYTKSFYTLWNAPISQREVRLGFLKSWEKSAVKQKPGEHSFNRTLLLALKLLFRKFSLETVTHFLATSMLKVAWLARFAWQEITNFQSEKNKKVWIIKIWKETREKNKWGSCRQLPATREITVTVYFLDTYMRYPLVNGLQETSISHLLNVCFSETYYTSLREKDKSSKSVKNIEMCLL